MKTERVRAIIIENDSLVSMYREFNDRVFYTFPGGGIEGPENEEECVIREVFEEFGLIIQPIKKVYIYENEKSVEHFYLCEIVGGNFGQGTGEEYQNNKNGVYKPTMIKLKEIKNLPLMPPEIAQALIMDYETFEKDLRNDILSIKGKMI